MTITVAVLPLIDLTDTTSPSIAHTVPGRAGRAVSQPSARWTCGDWLVAKGVYETTS